jgi:hypothetical protein
MRTLISGLLRKGSSNGADPARRRSAQDETAEKLEQHLSETKAVVLNHRRIPGQDGEISHLIVGPAGVTVIDARNYTSARARVTRGALRAGRRNRTDLIWRVLDQVERVRAVLAETPYADVQIEAALVWREVDGLPIIHSFNSPRVLICGTRKLALEAARPGPLSARRVKTLATRLEAELPAA